MLGIANRSGISFPERTNEDGRGLSFIDGDFEAGTENKLL
jgi:hypothetical protein